MIPQNKPSYTFNRKISDEIIDAKVSLTGADSPDFLINKVAGALKEEDGKLIVGIDNESVILDENGNIKVPSIEDNETIVIEDGKYKVALSTIIDNDTIKEVDGKLLVDKSTIPIVDPVLYSDLRDVFGQIYIRNSQFDNVTLGGETTWTVSSIDTVNKWVTLVQPIPKISSLLEIVSGKEWALLKGHYTGAYFLKGVNIVEVDWENNKIRYDKISSDGNLLAGEEVCFYNPFVKGDLIKRTPILQSEGSWNSTYIHSNSIWKHSDGTYRLICNGISSGVSRIGLAQSSDLINWSWLNGTTFNYEKFNTSWSYINGLYLTSSPVKYENDYIALAVGKNASDEWGCGWIIFDEDFNVKYKASTQLYIPDVAIPHQNQGSLTYFQGKWHAFIIHRTSISTPENWKLYHIVYKDILNYAHESCTLIAESTNDKSWTGNHIDTAVPIVYNSKLYLFVGGTGKRLQINNILSNKRTQGLMIYENGSWVKDFRNPLICNPIRAESFWGNDLNWTTQHIGGWGAYIIENGALYWFTSMSSSSDTYRPTAFKYSLLKHQ